ncbi:Immunoglobulin-like domain,Immunoglobulin-like fold,CD80-like, immunoglobulin C2-set [Cinara cedri]|uniref:Immunoglobulin-like domain,Immunoglobulin-like fold,CD80-like, immunoglobulin C2-set n=1 Tax=Cinara cedri TaxID=506608 RepID=A0A5E4MI83_9HEMI|nr:Immunoglobulin-like domain,Immunoglobulin-like fold,CD80-like, immunoglobulin C2-set [Cinara cedri]
MNALLYIFTLYILECVGLRDLQIHVPVAIPSGSTLQMNCTYDLENTALYSIKWYLRDQEFYRFVPKESPPTRVFAFPGITVDVQESDRNKVTIRNAQRILTGFYKCEVSADAPLFHTGIKTKLTYVTDEPSSPPTLHSNKMKYSAGDVINVSCITGESYPAVNVSWFLNNQTAKTVELVSITTYSEKREAELLITKSYLIFRIDRLSFPTGRIRVRCEISQFDLYRSSSEIELIDNAPPKLAEVIEPTPPPRSTGNAPRLRDWTSIITSFTMAALTFIVHAELLLV